MSSSNTQPITVNVDWRIETFICSLRSRNNRVAFDWPQRFGRTIPTLALAHPEAPQVTSYRRPHRLLTSPSTTTAHSPLHTSHKHTMAALRTSTSRLLQTARGTTPHVPCFVRNAPLTLSATPSHASQGAPNNLPGVSTQQDQGKDRLSNVCTDDAF